MNPIDTYVSNSIFPLKELIPGSLRNLNKYFSLITSEFRKPWIIIIKLMCIFFVYVFIRDTKRKKYIAFLVSILVLTAMLILSFGLYTILEEPSFSPRAMYGFGVFIALIGIAISTSQKVYPAKISILILSWMFIVFAFTYGNALKIQDEYTDFRVNLVIQDLNDLEVFTTNTKKNVQISGTIGHSPILINMFEEYNILRRLVPVQFRGNWNWGKYYFYNYFNLKNVKEDLTKNLKNYNLPILKETMYHTIRGNNNNILIELK